MSRRNPPTSHEGHVTREGRRVVGLDFVCRKHPTVELGRFRMWADPADGDDLWTYPLPDGTLPEDANKPGKALLLCPYCQTDTQFAEQRLRADLVALRTQPRVEIVKV